MYIIPLEMLADAAEKTGQARLANEIAVWLKKHANDLPNTALLELLAILQKAGT